MPGSTPGRLASLSTFFVGTFAVSWTCFIVAAFLAKWPAARALFFFVGIFAPSFVALALTARAGGRAGVVALLGRLIQWRVNARWYVLAIGFMAVVKLTVAGVHRITMGEWPRFGEMPWGLMLASTLVSTVIGGQAGEEIGWRGFALPRLAARFGFATSSVMLGVIWALWHLPLFYIAGTTTTGQSFPLYVLQVSAVSVALTWLYVGTNGSLLLTMLMHAAVNNFKDIVPSAMAGADNPATFSASLTAWLTVIVMWTFAAYFLFRLNRSGASQPEAASPVAL